MSITCSKSFNNSWHCYCACVGKSECQCDYFLKFQKHVSISRWLVSRWEWVSMPQIVKEERRSSTTVLYYCSRGSVSDDQFYLNIPGFTSKRNPQSNHFQYLSNGCKQWHLSVSLSPIPMVISENPSNSYSLICMYF